MIDIHNHMLFGVDDGAKTVDDSIALIKDAINKGASHIIFTPHYKLKDKSIELNMETVSQNFDILKKIVYDEKLDVELYLGNEIYFRSNFYELFEIGEFNTLAGSKYILIEFSVIDTPKNIPEMCYESRIRGYIPIIAHVERYESLYNDNPLLNEILNEGVHLQVNASTIINMESKRSYKFANYLLKNELISFVASDVHDLDARGFYLDIAYNRVKKLCGNNYADKIFYINQKKILSNEYFDTPKINLGRGGIISKLFKNKNY
nr:CpsB/CapC family capsule biosynthesis tyrosine phosphatase [Sedimentibacter sp.]